MNHIFWFFVGIVVGGIATFVVLISVIAEHLSRR